MPFVPKLALAALSVFGAQFAYCDSLYTFSSVSQTFADDPVTLGAVFSVNTSFEVTSLGWYAPNADGFQTPHTVGLYDSTGTLLASTTLATGVSNPLSGLFRYRSITPITLNSGSEYLIAGTSGGSLDGWTTNDLMSGFMVNPAFTIGADGARFAYGPDLVNPTSHFSDYMVYAGPNFEGHELVCASPEPSSFLLVALAATALVIARRFRSGSQRTAR